MCWYKKTQRKTIKELLISVCLDVYPPSLDVSFLWHSPSCNKRIIPHLPASDWLMPAVGIHLMVVLLSRRSIHLGKFIQNSPLPPHHQSGRNKIWWYFCRNTSQGKQRGQQQLEQAIFQLCIKIFSLWAREEWNWSFYYRSWEAGSYEWRRLMLIGTFLQELYIPMDGVEYNFILEKCLLNFLHYSCQS